MNTDQLNIHIMFENTYKICKQSAIKHWRNHKLRQNFEKFQNFKCSRFEGISKFLDNYIVETDLLYYCIKFENNRSRNIRALVILRQKI